METKQKESRQNLNRRLYNAARMATAEAWRNDPDKVKEVRDLACADMYGEHYSDLTDREIAMVIEHLNVLNGTLEPEKAPRACASARQLRALRYYALACAIHYCGLPNGYRYYDEKTQTYLSGEELRQWIKREFEDAFGKLPGSVFTYLHNSWINPKCNEMLQEGRYRKWAREAHIFYYHYLRPEEATYLIKRYRAIAENLGVSLDPRNSVNYISNN